MIIAPIDVLTSSGKYPEREQSEECTTSVRVNAADTSERTSKLLDHLGFTRKVTSGFRTRASNQKASGAKMSNHMRGCAVDIEDADGKLAQAILADTSVLNTFDMYMECPQYTKGWVHLQIAPPLSRKRIFNP